MPGPVIHLPRKDGVLKATKGIEVGHVFMLGTKYSQTMNASFLDPNGKECLAVMGCYGIGIGRTAAAAVEQHHDDKGIILAYPIAPFSCAPHSIGPIRWRCRGYHLSVPCAGDGGPGSLVGRSRRTRRGQVQRRRLDRVLQVIVGDKGLTEGLFIKTRKTGHKTKLAPAEIPARILQMASQPS